MISAKSTFDPDSIHFGAAARHQARGEPARQVRVDSAQVFHASCRPHSWSMFGVHMRHVVGRSSQPAAPVSDQPAAAHPMQRDEAASAVLVEAARSLAPQLGRCRVWLWCAGRLPSRRFMTLLAGCAALRDVSRAHLGLEVSAQAIAAAGGREGQQQLDDLLTAGIGVMLRLSVPQRLGPRAQALAPDAVSGGASSFATDPGPDLERLAREVERAHALGLSVVAAGVWRREWAVPLGEAGFAAVSGPAVCQPTDLGGLMKFIGPAEPWLARMSADSV